MLGQPRDRVFSPSFQNIRSPLYRAEYLMASVAILAYLIWRTFYGGGVDWLQVIFWVVFPDLAAFGAIGVSARRNEWPRWGTALYNVFHTVLTWTLIFAVSWFVFGFVYAPITGWLLHITTDRAAGYYLRANGPVR